MEVFQPSTFANGRFVVEREIGRGGMGVVYKAIDREREMPVALKTLRQLDLSSIYFFKREFRSLHDLVHPNLCSLIELINDGGVWLLTMELVEGVDFLSYQRKRESASYSYDESKLRNSLIGLCRGLVALHRAGKVHRDIKPSNVLITAEGRVVLLDFGVIADKEYEREHLNSLVGTAEYMAPEQTDTAKVGPEADCYAVGVMLFEALTGKLPFQGKPLQIILEKRKMPPPMPRDFQPNVPGDLDRICLQLLCQNPPERPTAEEVLRALKSEQEDPQKHYPYLGTPVPLEPFFVGRKEELRALKDAYQKTATGHSQTVVIEGVSGVGKSALIENFVTKLQTLEPGPVILEGRCYERELAPFKAFDGIIESLIRHVEDIEIQDAAIVSPPNASLLTRLFPALVRLKIFSGVHDRIQEIQDAQILRERGFDAVKDMLFRVRSLQKVVIVVDDMQWADVDSNALLKHIVSEPGAPPLLLVLLTRSQKDTRSVDADWDAACRNRITRLHLEPLDDGASLELAHHASQSYGLKTGLNISVLAKETEGHPLFIAELIRYVAVSGQHWQSLSLDDVIWRRIGELSAKAVQILKTLSVAGTPMSWKHLQSLTVQSSEEFYRNISTLRSQNLIRSRGSRVDHIVEPYHDRVREAVHARALATGEAIQINLDIGRFFLRDFSESEIDENVFTIVRHLGAAKSLILDEQEIDKLTELNLQAGIKARNASAYDVSLGYFETGIELLSSNAWETKYELALRLHEEAAEAAHLAMERAKVQYYTETVCARARTILDMSNAVDVKIRSLYAEGRHADVLYFGTEALVQLGLNIRSRLTPKNVFFTLLRAKISLLGKKDKEIFELPPMRDEKMLAAMRLLSSMTMSAYLTDHALYASFIFTQILLISKHGHSVFSPITFVSYGLILCAKLGDVEGGYRMGALADRLKDEYFNRFQICRTLFVNNCFIRPWKHHFSDCRSGLKKAFELGMSSGNFQYAANAITFDISNSLFAGHDLGSLYREATDAIQTLTKMKQSSLTALMIAHQRFIRNLCQEVANPCLLDGDGESEAELVARTRLDKAAANERGIIHLKLILHGYFGEYASGLGVADQMVAMAEADILPPTTTLSLLCGAIIYLRATSNFRSKEGKRNLRYVMRIEREITQRAQYAPMNCLHMLRLLQAEKHRALKKNYLVSALYEQASESALKQGFVYVEALANELAAEYHLENHRRAVAQTYASRAFLAYCRWGARAKVEHLEQRFGGLLAGVYLPNNL